MNKHTEGHICQLIGFQSCVYLINPILYMPLTDATNAGQNLGTGGDFTVNGNPCQSGRGPNQYNAVANHFDGVADYLTKSSAPTGAVNSKTLTLSFDMRPQDAGAS